MKDPNVGNYEKENFNKTHRHTSLKFRENFLILPSKKIEANQQFFRFSDNFRAELKEESKEVLEKFVDCFMDDLATKENVGNVSEILEICFKNNVDAKVIGFLLTKLIELAKADTHLNPIKLSKLYNLMEFQEKNNEALLFSAPKSNVKFHIYR